MYVFICLHSPGELLFCNFALLFCTIKIEENLILILQKVVVNVNCLKKGL